MMQERLLHTLWQYSLYNPTGLATTSGEPVTIIQAGRYNTDAGPDFLEAKVKVGDTTLAGHVEMHVRSSDWAKHGHAQDEKYKNIILHVVYEDDTPADGPAHVPVLCLQPFVPADVLKRYEYLAYAKTTLPCEGRLQDVKDITRYSWLTRLLAERWDEKLGGWQQLLEESKGDWSSLLYWRLAANFGFKVNADAFLALARSLPLNILAKHRENLLQVEALLFGQAGMLTDVDGVYPNALKTEYEYLSKKYKLEPIPVHRWNYLRLRPANFPTIRIGQFAALVHQSVHLFSVIIEKSTVHEIMPLFDVQASHYWETHYRFGEAAEKDSKKKLGKSSIQNIIINTVAPLKFLYASQQDTELQQEQALRLLDELPAEKNHIVDKMVGANWPPTNASQSQAQIQLYNNYCSKKRCLDCAIGLSLMKS